MEKALKYIVIVPDGYEGDQNKRWPLILNLHGGWPRTEDSLEIPPNEVVVKNVREHHRPYVVLAPLCPPDQGWEVEPLLRLLANIQEDYRIDPDRIILTGGSMGGRGAWKLADAQPNFFAALIPLCAGTKALENPSGVLTLPIWVFHGVQDDIVPIDNAENLVAELQALGGNVKFTKLEGLGHGIGETVFDMPELWDWIGEQRRPE